MENFETPYDETDSSFLRGIFENNPELARIYEGSTNKEIESNESGRIVRDGHEYENSERMKAIVGLADAIRDSLPSVQSGFIRLWRGNRQNEVGHNPSYTNSLEGIALPFLGGYKGVLSYVDIREDEAEKYLRSGGVAEGSEFILPPELMKEVKIVGFSSEQAGEIMKRAVPLSNKPVDGWKSV